MKKLIRNIILLSTIIIFAVSCSDNEGIISKDKIIVILTDLHKANIIFSDLRLSDTKLKEKNASHYNYIFKKYNITRAEFEKTLKYYSYNLGEYIIIYDEVVAKLEKEELDFVKPVTNMFDIHDLVKDSIAKRIADDALWIEIWTKEKKWTIPEDTLITNISDSLTLKNKCKLKLNTDILVYKNINCENPHIILKAFYKDKSVDTLIIDTLIKDAKFHNYKFEAKTDSIKKPDYIICNIINCADSIKSMHIKIKNISLKKYIIDKKKRIEIRNEALNDKKLKNKKNLQKDKLLKKTPKIMSNIK